MAGLGVPEELRVRAVWRQNSETSIARPGMTTNTFAYNGFGARVSKTDSAGTTTSRACDHEDRVAIRGVAGRVSICA